jgi:hypothetical protein
MAGFKGAQPTGSSGKWSIEDVKERRYGFLPTQASGGEEVQDYVDATDGKTYRYHKFTTSSDNLDVTFINYEANSADALIVAGGGGSPSHGGGGAGGFQEISTNLELKSHIVEVGAGGADGTSVGSDSQFDGVVSLGGGYGGVTAEDGGSGGGGTSTYYSGYAKGLGTPGQGNDGNIAGARYNDGYYGGVWAAGGGGGAAASGGYGNVNGDRDNKRAYGGAGGAGVASTITGSSIFYAGGGGAQVGYPWGWGSRGGGGAGGGGYGTSPAGAGTPGAENTGGGAGGGGTSGGSGVVVVRYPVSE